MPFYSFWQCKGVSRPAFSLCPIWPHICPQPDLSLLYIRCSLGKLLFLISVCVCACVWFCAQKCSACRGQKRASESPRAAVVVCVPWCFCSFSSLKCVLSLGFTVCLNLWIHSLFQVGKILHNYFFNYVFCLPHPISPSLKTLLVSSGCQGPEVPMFFFRGSGWGREGPRSHLPLLHLRWFLHTASSPYPLLFFHNVWSSSKPGLGIF